MDDVAITKVLELNNNSLADFDKLMSMHLDQVEELIITSVSTNPRFYNIVGLCINLKTLKIVGNLKINTNTVISNIFNIGNIETLVFDGVRLPTLKIISKFENIKYLRLNNIKFSSIKGFLGNFNKDSVSKIEIENSDFCKAPISIFADYKNLKDLIIRKCDNCKFDDYTFVAKNYNLNNIEIDSAFISFDQLGNITKGKSTKNISAQLGKTTKKSLINKIYLKDNEINVVINSIKLKELSENINFNKIDKMLLTLNKNANLVDYMKILKRVKQEIIITVNDFSELNAEDALLLKEQLNVRKIKVINKEDAGGTIDSVYTVDEYIQIKNRIDEFVMSVADETENVLEKVIIIYKGILLSNLRNSIGNLNVGQLTDMVNKKCDDYNYAELFYNCLNGLNVPVKIIRGKDLEGNVKYWNQVKIYDYWYNVDLYDDCKNITKKVERKPKYFLVIDKNFYKDRTVGVGVAEQCIMEIDKKLINEYFKEEKEEIKWIVKLINKLKRLFVFNKRTVMLPAPDVGVSDVAIDAESNDKREVVNNIEVTENSNKNAVEESEKLTNEEIDLLNQIEGLEDI